MHTSDGRWWIVLIVLAAVVLYLWGLGRVDFQDPDEGMYAEIAREMVAGGDWVVPRFNGVPYIEKPPLMYWLTASTFALIGPSEFTARMWKVIPMLGAIAVTGTLGSILFCADAGIIASAALATTLGVYLFSRISVMDPLLLLGVTLSALGVTRAGQERASRLGALVSFWGGVVIGTMSKGFPGIVFPIMLVLAWMGAHRSAFALRRLWDWRVVAVALLLIVPWHVAAAYRVPGFAQFYFVDNQVWRFLGNRTYQEDGRGLSTSGFWLISFCVGFPWTPYFIAALQTCRRRLRDPRVRFLLSWNACIIGMFSVSSFKLEYYALPAFPAAVLLIAGVLTAPGALSRDRLTSAEGGATRPFRLWTVISVAGGILFCVGVAWSWSSGLFTPLTIVQALTFWSTNYRIIFDDSLPLPAIIPSRYAASLLAGGLIWVIGFAVALWWLRRSRPVRIVWATALVGCGLCLVCGHLLQEVGPHHSVRPLADRLVSMLRPSDIIIHERGLEKSGGLIFRIQRPVLVLNGASGDLDFGSRQPGSERIFISTAAFERIWRGSTRTFLITDLPPARSALATVGDAGRVPIVSTGTRWLYMNQTPS
ncbi:MAG TPA: glycosyltransferase family 39 protein [Candidatus Baltobacteraceae bacterium]|nr:glycosyltransferase family 39 protein [Candidatus Baltobacteraceae bacterium]